MVTTYVCTCDYIDAKANRFYIAVFRLLLLDLTLYNLPFAWSFRFFSFFHFIAKQPTSYHLYTKKTKCDATKSKIRLYFFDDYDEFLD